MVRFTSAAPGQSHTQASFCAGEVNKKNIGKRIKYICKEQQRNQNKCMLS